MNPLVFVTRGELLECIHYGDIAIANTFGDLVAAVGNPLREVYWRSSAKPIQAFAVVQSGAAERYNLSAPELAITCASHYGSAAHVATVRSLLRKAEIDEAALQCGTHPPIDTQENYRLIREGLAPLPVHNNCSGKHAGMLVATRASGADIADYLSLQAPVQQRILSNISLMSSVPRDDIIFATDGCGAPVHGMSLQAMATAFARLVAPRGLPEEIVNAANRVTSAMAAAPVMVSGEGTFNSDLLAAAQGRIIAKGGAEGLFMMGIANQGLGVAIRTVDGSHRGHGAVALRVLEQLGALDDGLADSLWHYTNEAQLNCCRETVGTISAADFSLDFK